MKRTPKIARDTNVDMTIQKKNNLKRTRDTNITIEIHK